MGVGSAATVRWAAREGLKKALCWRVRVLRSEIMVWYVGASLAFHLDWIYYHHSSKVGFVITSKRQLFSRVIGGMSAKETA